MIKRLVLDSSNRDKWVRFDGSWEEVAAHRSPFVGSMALLHPSEDPRIRIAFTPSKLRLIEDHLYVRVGAKPREVYVPPDSPTASAAIPEPRAGVCQGGGTRCLGQLETCCNDGRVIGNCSGTWLCTGDTVRGIPLAEVSPASTRPRVERGMGYGVGVPAGAG